MCMLMKRNGTDIKVFLYINLIAVPVIHVSTISLSLLYTNKYNQFYPQFQPSLLSERDKSNFIDIFIEKKNKKLIQKYSRKEKNYRSFWQRKYIWQTFYRLSNKYTNSTTVIIHIKKKFKKALKYKKKLQNLIMQWCFTIKECIIKIITFL